MTVWCVIPTAFRRGIRHVHYFASLHSSKPEKCVETRSLGAISEVSIKEGDRTLPCEFGGGRVVDVGAVPFEEPVASHRVLMELSLTTARPQCSPKTDDRARADEGIKLGEVKLKR